MRSVDEKLVGSIIKKMSEVNLRKSNLMSSTAERPSEINLELANYENWEVTKEAHYFHGQYHSEVRGPQRDLIESKNLILLGVLGALNPIATIYHAFDSQGFYYNHSTSMRRISSMDDHLKIIADWQKSLK